MAAAVTAAHCSGCDQPRSHQPSWQICLSASLSHNTRGREACRETEITVHHSRAGCWHCWWLALGLGFTKEHCAPMGGWGISSLPHTFVFCPSYRKSQHSPRGQTEGAQWNQEIVRKPHQLFVGACSHRSLMLQCEEKWLDPRVHPLLPHYLVTGSVQTWL